MDIEEAKMQLREILKVRKEQKEIIECAGGYCGNCNPDIKAIETILSELDKDNNIISDLQNEVTLKQSELDKKEKIINDMAKWIEKHTGYAIDETLYKESKEYIIDHFTNKYEEGKG